MVTLSKRSGALRKFFIAGERLEFKRGQIIIKPEEEPSGVFYIESGYVKAVNNTKYNEENMLVLRQHAEVFPLIWVITGDNRKVGYVAHTDCVIYKQQVDALEDLTTQSTDAMRELLLVTTVMYQAQAERVNSLILRTVRERAAYFLLTLARRFGKEHPEGILIEVPLTRFDIASSVSATRETISREFSYLKTKGIVRQESGHLLITDMEELVKLTQN